ncbi:MAG: DegV family protein, partial [Dictyoglomus sp.]
MQKRVNVYFKVITDTTSDIPKEITKRLEIEIVPYYIHLQNKSYKENIDI